MGKLDPRTYREVGARLASPWILAAAVLVAAAACSASTPAPQPLVMGAIYPLSGSQAQGGKEELGGLQAALAVARQRGDLGGREVQLHVQPVETPGGAAAAVDRLVDKYHVQVIAGTYGSTLAEAAAARAEARRVVYWETGAVADDVTQGRHWVFRTVATGMSLGRTAVDFTKSDLSRPGGSAVIVNVDDVYGRSVADGEVAEAAAQGIRVAARIEYDPFSYDPAAVARQVGEAHATWLWDVSYIDDGIAIWRQVVAQGIHLEAAVGTSSAFCMAQFGATLGSQAVGVFAADKPDGTINPTALSPAARTLLTQARTAYGGELTIPAVAGFVGGWTLFHDVVPRLPGNPSAAAIRSAAQAVDEPVGSEINGGGVKFDAGQNLRAATVVGQWQPGPVMRVVYPAGYATASPI
ncbi:MAG TPA: ABC transporter substrate-binding protein [Candidatus Dormibacteraeota bacterium]